MTDKKLSDNEIIKALECCTKGLECKNCPANPHKGNYGYCTGLLLKDTLDLINRLQEKDETRHKVFETKCEELEIAKAENERLNKNLETETNHITRLENQIERLLPRLETIKAEAYKEFAERLKNKLTSCSRTIDGKSEYLICDSDIDNLLKELVGDSNES